MAEGVEPVSWEAVEVSLRRMARGPSPHKLSPWVPTSSRRAAVAVMLWGDPEGARELVLVQRGDGAPHHAGELACPGGMVDAEDRDLPATARRELWEELGLRDGLWELGCLPDGVAKARTRFTPVVLRWEDPDRRLVVGPEIARPVWVGLRWLLQAPWTQEVLVHQGTAVQAPRLLLPGLSTPLWGATALVLHAWLRVLEGELR